MKHKLSEWLTWNEPLVLIAALLLILYLYAVL
jgi:hypothetical protein